MDLQSIQLDAEKLDGGIWWRLSVRDGQLVGDQVDEPAADDPAILLVPMGTSYERQLEKEREPYMDKLRDKDTPADELERLTLRTAAKALAHSVVRDWQNITFKGEAVGYSQAKAAELLADRTFRNLLDFVLLQSSQRAAALVKTEADSAGN
jgi:hypothetical protein